MTDINESCCGPDCCSDTPTPNPADVRDAVRESYATIAKTGTWSGVQAAPAADASADACGAGGGCCGPTTMTADDVAAAVGYGAAELAAVPDGANMGLSCGNPTALAALAPGEVVLDLGSGGGFDCFVAGPRVGPTGRVIGVDMTPEMLGKARRNLDAYRTTSGLDNVEFRLGEIEHLPVADASVDVVISNCVINLSPDKPRVYHEMFRVLKPGGRVAVSDLALLKPLPAAVRSDVEALVGCVAGAALVEETRRMMLDAGFTDLEFASKPEYVAAMADSADPLYRRILDHLPAGTTVSDYVTSLDVSAVRRRSCCGCG
ncbi:MAG: arsenite methyltransferase [Phycisphaerales bacterium]|nr:arsenite methyltransferase [Phycisphaerales bacterium]